MAKYVLVYTGGGAPRSEAEQAAVMAAWEAWYGQLGPTIADGGKPFGPSQGVAADGTVSASAPSGLTGYTILNADSLTAAVGMAKGCPILTGGGSVEVYETFDIM